MSISVWNGHIYSLKLSIWKHSLRFLTIKDKITCYFYGGGLVTKSCLILEIPWIVAHQVPLSMGFSRQEYWNGLQFPSPGDHPNPGIKTGSPVWEEDSLPTVLQEKPYFYKRDQQYIIQLVLIVNT